MCEDHGVPYPSDMPTVFMSYARVDRGPHLDRFHQDLVTLLSQKGGHLSDDVVFRDSSDIDWGDRWPDELSHSLASARALVCLCSPLYFTRPWCGKEFGFFRDRVITYAKEKKLAKVPPLIFPVLWIPAKKGAKPFPEMIRDLQSTQGFGDVYDQQGLQYILRLNKHADEYQDILTVMADRIIEAVADNPLPETLSTPPVASLVDVFAADAFNAKPSANGPGHVQFILVAAPRIELEQLPMRRQLAAYGESSNDWRPFQPPRESRIGPLLQGLAAEADFTSDLVRAESDIAERVRRAQADNSLVLLVVDPWTLRIQLYHEYLKKYDEQEFLNSAVLVPWNDNDDETIGATEELETALEATFEHKMAAADPKTFRGRIATAEQLKIDVCEALITIRKRILEHGVVIRKAKALGVFIKPVISAVAT
jgi:FxsC-like protein